MNTQKKSNDFLYGVTLFFITLSGFAQMPIFKRYYIADIPGLGWLAKFYVTHSIHYLSAGILIAIVIYVVLDFLFSKSDLFLITKAGYFKIVLLAGLIISGSLMVIKNLSAVYFSHNIVIALDLIHLSLCMMLLAVTFYTLIWKR